MHTRFRLQEKEIYRLLHTVLFLCICLLCASGFLGIQNLTVLHFLAAFCVIALITGISLFTIKGKLLCLSSLFVLFTAVVATVGMETSISFLRSYCQWFIGRPGWVREWTTGYELIQTLLVSIACYFLQMLLEKYLFLKLGLAGTLLCGLLYCLFSKTQLPHAGVVFLLCYIVIACVEGIQSRWEKNRHGDAKTYMLWIMPFFAFYFLLMLLMPAPDKPYDWQFVKSAYHQIRESFLNLTQNLLRGKEEDFDTSLSGFSQEATLGGDLQQDDRIIMVIQGEDSLVTNIYLQGKIYDTFDGRQWLQKNQDSEPERLLDTVETLCAARSYSGGYLRDYMYRTTLLIRYQYYNTSYLFAPLKTESIRQNEMDLSFFNAGGSLLFSEPEGYGTTYEVTYYQLNIDQEGFYRFLETGPAPDEAILERALHNVKKANGESCTQEDLLSHSQKIHDVYLDEVVLSNEVAQYLQEITGDAGTDIDKLRLIEQALSSFTYTLTPGRLPETVTDETSFLNYFLLESREGYCTYFATAFTLLARAEGFPARYVQGFCVPVSGEEETPVYAYMAHAWPEVYIDGVGWIPFEPTPGYAQIRYTPWEMMQQDDSFLSDMGTHYQTGPGETAAEPSLEPQEKEEVSGNSYEFWKIPVYAVLSILVICLLVLATDRLIGRCRYHRMDTLGKLMAEVSKNLRILSLLGYTRNSGETLEEFKDRTGLALQATSCPLAFIENYEAILYGDRKADNKMIESAVRDRLLLLQLLKEKKKWKYYFIPIFLQ